MTPHLKSLATLLLLCFTLSLTGCLQFRYLVRVNPDGSGTVEERVLMSAEIRSMMESMRAMFDEETEPLSPLLDEEELRQRAPQFGEGVAFQSAEPASEEGFEGYVATYTFTDINKLSLNLESATKASGVDTPAPAFGPKSGGGATFTFQRGTPATLVIHRIPEEDVEEPDDDAQFEWEGDFEWDTDDDDEMDEDDQEMMIEQARAFLGGMQFVMEVEVNGTITETNAQHRNGSRITLMEIDFDRVLGDEDGLRAFMEVEDMTEDEAIDRLNNIPGIRMEPADEVRVVFQ